MSGAWVAGSVRARLLVAERRLGPDGAADVAAAGSLQEALVRLGRSPYRREVALEQGLEQAQRAVTGTALLNLRVLAGWLPADALGLLRALAAWYELANLEDRLAYLSGGELRHPFELGSLAAAWPRAAGAQSLEELRRILAASPWGDPDGATAAELGVGLRLAWARRVDEEAPEAGTWAAAAAALLVARQLFVSGLPIELLPVPTLPLLGDRWQGAPTLTRFVEELPPQAAWALDGVTAADELWQAEARWWARVEAEAEAMLRGSAPGRRVVVAATALLGADAHRACSALAAAGRHGLTGVEEAFGAAA